VNAANQARDILGIDDLGTTALFDLADAILGPRRSAKYLELSRLVRLTRRSVATSALAEVVVGTRDLGIEWWSRPHQEMSGLGIWLSRGTPDELLTRAPGSASEAEMRLSRLGDWAADDAADARWGRPIDFVDLNDARADDRLRLPDGIAAGDRVVASFDPGSRVWAVIVRRDKSDEAAQDREGYRRNGLGSVLAEHELINVAEVGWAYAIATNTGPIHLPGETAGQHGDPFTDLVQPEAAERLSSWALKHDEEIAKQCQWLTRGDVWSAYFRLGLPYSRTGEWWPFERAATAVVDGEVAEIERRMMELT
jgi:hypothetical protein